MPLIVPLPPKNVARLRFVDGGTWMSKAIEARSGADISHVEAVMADGTIVASLVDIGVQRFANDYDTTSTMQVFIDIPMDEHMYDQWTYFLWDACGAPYDTEDLYGDIFDLNLHTRGAYICSAVQVAAERHCGWLEHRLALQFSEVTPAILLMMHLAQPRGRVTVHSPEYLKGK